jgi:hypothetical protein
MWSPQGCVSVEAPCEATFVIISIKWNPDGKSLVLIGKDQFCINYLQQSANGKESTDENEEDDEEEEKSDSLN